MASDLTEVVDLASWPKFRRQVRAAMVKSAINVGAETSIPGDPRSQQRRFLSVNVFEKLDDYEARFAIAVAANPVITHESSDSDIEFTVNAVWDTIAGAPPAPAED